MRAAKRKIVELRARGKLHLQVDGWGEKMICRWMEMAEIVEMTVAERCFFGLWMEF